VASELTLEVLMAFTHGVRVSSMKVALDLLKKVKLLWETFTSVKGAWEDFKRLVGVKTDSLIGVMKDLPGAIKRLMDEGKKALSKIGDYLKEKIPPLKIFLEAGVKLPALGEWLNRAIDVLPPAIAQGISKITAKVKALPAWIDSLLQQYPVLKPLGKITSAGIFAYIWFHATELSWDIPEIIRGFLGGYSFLELLQSLPESVLGLITGLLFPGIPSGLIWNALLPATIALRIAWLVYKNYAYWHNGKLQIDWAKIGMTPPASLLPIPL